MLRIEFGGEASETFADFVNEIEGYCVRITLQSGSQFDATIVGSGNDEGWHDAVRYRRNDENDEPKGPVRIARVESVHVY